MVVIYSFSSSHSGTLLDSNVVSIFLIVMLLFIVGIIVWIISIYLSEMKKLNRQLQNVRKSIADIEFKEESYSKVSSKTS